MVCGLAADSDSVHQADNRLPAMRLRSLCGYPYPSLHILSLFSLQLGKVSAACSCCWMHSHWMEDWTGLDWTDWALPRLCAPQGLDGSIPWRTYYKVARSKQGITASSSLACSNAAIAELSKGSNTPPANSANLQLTMQHKSCTA